MKRSTKNTTNIIDKKLLLNRVKIKIFEKKPKKGGIPAADKNEISNVFVKVGLKLNELNKLIVFVVEFFNWNKTANTGINERL